MFHLKLPVFTQYTYLDKEKGDFKVINDSSEKSNTPPLEEETKENQRSEDKSAHTNAHYTNAFDTKSQSRRSLEGKQSNKPFLPFL